MRILVVGAAAAGGYFGARLADAGRDVTFFVRPERAERLRRDGLRVLSPQGDLNLKPRLLVAGAPTEPFDVVLLAVKAFGLERALDDFGAAVGPETMILPTLNGMRHIDLLVERFGEAAVLGGFCVVAARLDRHGCIVQLASGMETLTYGERDGSLTEGVRRLHDELQGAGFDARLNTAILQEMWEKWIMLASASAATCLLRGTIGEIEAVPSGADVTLRCLAKSVAMDDELGHPPREKFAKATKPILTARAASLRDLDLPRHAKWPASRSRAHSRRSHVEGAQTRPRHAAPRRRDGATVDLPEPTVAKGVRGAGELSGVEVPGKAMFRVDVAEEQLPTFNGRRAQTDDQIGFVKVTAGRLRMAQHAQPQRPLGREGAPLGQRTARLCL